MTGYTLVELGDGIHDPCCRCSRVARVTLLLDGAPALDALDRPLRFCRKHGNSEIVVLRRAVRP